MGKARHRREVGCKGIKTELDDRQSLRRMRIEMR